MESKLLAMSHFFARLPDKVLRHRWTILLFLALGTVFMVYGAVNRTSLDMSIDSFIDQDDPAITALNEFRSQFGSDDSIFLVYRAADGNVFSEASLRAVQTLTRQLENWDALSPDDFPTHIDGLEVDLDALDYIRRIQSLSNLRVQRVEGDTLRSDRLVPETIPSSADELATIKARALAEEDFKLAFYSADGRFGAIMVQTFFGSRPTEDYVPAVNQDSISLGDSFSSANFADDFSLSFDESATVADIPFQSVDMFTYTNFFTALQAVYQIHANQLEFFPAGNAPTMEFVYRALQQLLWLGAGMIAIFVVLLWILFRSFSAVVWPILTIAFSVVWTWGGTAWLGAPLTTMISLTCLLIFAVGIADCVHVMSAYFSIRKQGVSHQSALSQAYGKTGLAILVTTLTTMAGVMALTYSDLIPIKVFGWMSAAGVFLALLFTMLLLPLLLSLWHPGASPKRTSPGKWLAQRWQQTAGNTRLFLLGAWCVLMFVLLGPVVGLYLAAISVLTYVVVNYQDAILASVPGLVARSPRNVLLLFAALFLACLYGTSLVKIDSNLSELTREGSSLRVAYEIVDDNMAGAQNMEIMIDTGISDGLMEPALLQAVDTLQRRILERYPDQVSRTYSLVNIIKETNRIMNNDDPAFYRIPDSAAMVTQLLYLFNSANPEDRRSLVSDDYSRSHITINAYNAGSYQYQQFFDELSLEIEQIFGDLDTLFPALDVRVTGSIPLMMRATDEIARSQYNSFLLALTVISGIMILTLGSVQAGLISIVPNLIPALLAFGLMGLLDLPLDADTLLIAPVIIGIAVDDTIHFMTHYRIELIKTRNMALALRSTVNEVGKAVMFTTMVLGLGFAMLSFSAYLGMAKIGFFGSLAIFVALLCDLFLLPALIMTLKPRFGMDADQLSTDGFEPRGEIA
ncbi:MAG: MMPL family transporter [Pseudomonadales bacterium]|nr:MMPL family transporter [Pseudomonadales bacterium]